MNIKNILVPTDFSEPSHIALNYAVYLARKLRAHLTLLHVVEPQPAFEMAVATVAVVEQERIEDAALKLEGLLAPEDEDDLDLHNVVRTGIARLEIKEAVEQLHADLVVMGTHGRGGLGRLILGSTAEALLRQLNVPVLTVCHAASPGPVSRILLATDLSDASHRVFNFALDLARTLEAQIVVFHALGGPAMTSGELGIPVDTDQAERELSGRLAKLAAEGNRSGVEIQTLITGGLAAPEILKASSEQGADMILLAVDKKGVLERVLLGATAERVIRESQLPVLSIPVRIATHENAAQAV